MLRYVILGLLYDGGPLHGFALAKAFRLRSGQAIRSGSLYRELGRLQELGLIEKTENPPDADPRRVPYRITERGKRAFETWEKGPLDGNWSPNSPLLDALSDPLALRSVLVAGLPDRLEVVSRWKQELMLLGSRLEAAHTAAVLRGSNPTVQLLLRRRKAQVVNDVAFLDELPQKLGGTATVAAPDPAGEDSATNAASSEEAVSLHARRVHRRRRSVVRR